MGFPILVMRAVFFWIGSVRILQQAEHTCIKSCKAQFGPLILDELEKKECGKFRALVQQVCESDNTQYLFLDHPFLPAWIRLLQTHHC